MTVVGVSGGGSTAPYAGPGDILGNAHSFWGLRAYKRAIIGSSQSLIEIRRADGTLRQFVALSNGLVDVPGITTFLTATTGVINVMFDQTGNGHHLQGSVSTFPAWVTADATGLPCARFNGANNIQDPGNDTVAGPLSLIGVCLSNNTAAANRVFLGAVFIPSVVVVGGAVSGQDDLYAYAGSTLDNTGAAHGVLHDFTAVLDGASSHMYVDAVDSAGNAGTNTVTAARWAMGSNGFSNFWLGDGKEGGVWSSALSGLQATLYHANARAFWHY